MDLGDDYYEFSSTQIRGLLEDLIKTSPCLERLVLIAKRPIDQRNRRRPILLEDLILSFVSKMKNLVVFCLVGLEIYPFVLLSLQKRMELHVTPSRPALWMHFGPELPECTDLSVPRVHYDGIVNPSDPYFAPPKLY